MIGVLVGSAAAAGTLLALAWVLRDGWRWQREHEAEVSHQRAMEALRQLRYCVCGEPEHEPNEECDGPYGDLTDCPYFRRYAGVPGADPDGICSYGCHSEPACVTDRPLDGWPREAALFRGHLGGSDG